MCVYARSCEQLMIYLYILFLSDVNDANYCTVNAIFIINLEILIMQPKHVSWSLCILFMVESGGVRF